MDGELDGRTELLLNASFRKAEIHNTALRSLDTRTSILLGVHGVFLAQLLLLSPNIVWDWSLNCWTLTVALAFLAMGIVCCVLSLTAREKALLPDVAQTAMLHGHRPAEDIARQMISNMHQLLDAARKTLKVKEISLGSASIFLATSLMCIILLIVRIGVRS